MKRDPIRGIMLAAILFAVVAASAESVVALTIDAADAPARRQWARRHLLLAEVVPFSFTYDGQPSRSLLRAWARKDETKSLDGKGTQRTTTWSDPRTGLEVRCVSVEYSDFPVVEWTLHFRNRGKKETPIIEDVRALDLRLDKPPGDDFVLHGCKGDSCTPDSFQPYAIRLGPGESRSFAPPGGRPTEGVFPYYNLARSDGGLILAVGWPGQWRASFTRAADNTLHVVAGQERTHFKLLPGEEARSPLATLLFWKGADWIDGQNVWRRWMVAHNLPRPGGKLVPTHYGSCWSATLYPNAEEELAIVDGFQREGIRLDYYFIDAGWYPTTGGWWATGTWEVDKTRFPRGIREVSDRVHRNGAKFVLWFEPERLVDGSWLAVHHPEWILKSGDARLLNLGNRDAWNWVVKRIDDLITSEGVDVYRQDFNMQPLGCWRAADAPDRQGLAEIRHVEGYLAFWDEILRRHPDLYIDTCASGGRRNDLETLRRSVPLLRSDCFSPDETQQAHTMGLALWVPYFGSGMGPGDVYSYRSCIFPASRIGIDTRKTDQDYALLKQMIAEFREVEGCLLGDFYPLTEHSLAPNVWVAWQFNRPEDGHGIVQAFRRAECPQNSIRLRLRGLDPRAAYRLKDFDVPGTTETLGKDLMENGLLVKLPKPRSSCIIRYERAIQIARQTGRELARIPH